MLHIVIIQNVYYTFTYTAVKNVAILFVPIWWYFITFITVLFVRRINIITPILNSSYDMIFWSLWKSCQQFPDSNLYDMSIIVVLLPAFVLNVEQSINQSV